MQKRNTKRLLTLCLAAALLLGLPMAALADDVEVTEIIVTGVGSSPMAGLAPVDIEMDDIEVTSIPAGAVAKPDDATDPLRWTENNGDPIVGNFAAGKTYKLTIPVEFQALPGQDDGYVFVAATGRVTNDTFGLGTFVPVDATNLVAAVVFTFTIPPEAEPSYPGSDYEPQPSPSPLVAGLPNTGGSGGAHIAAVLLVCAASLAVAVLYGTKKRSVK